MLSVNYLDTLTTINNLAEVLVSQGKYLEAESMHRQTLATSERVLGVNHPDTLMSVHCLAHLLASRRYYVESTALYERACAGYNTTLGKDHPLSRACHRHYAQMLVSAAEPSDSGGRRSAKGSELLGEFAKLGLRHATGSPS